MDSSSRFNGKQRRAILSGGVRFSSADLSSSEQLILLDRATKVVGIEMRGMSLLELGDADAVAALFREARVTRRTLYNVGTATQSARCMCVTSISEAGQLAPAPAIAEADLVHILLLLSRDKEWFTATLHAVEAATEAPEMLQMTYHLLHRDELASLLAHDDELLERIMASLTGLIKTTMDRRSEQLAGLELAHHRLCAVSGLIEP
jgi:hypothetical protein